MEAFGVQDVSGSARFSRPGQAPCTILDLLTDSLSRVQDKMAALLVANTLLWPMARFLNDKFVPEEHRVTANHIMTVRQHFCVQMNLWDVLVICCLQTEVSYCTSELRWPTLV